MNQVLKVTKTIMNCPWEIKCYPQSNLSKEASLKIINEAFLVAKIFEDEFSVFKASPFNEINRFAGIEWVSVSAECIELLLLSKKYYKESNGQFNIAFLGSEGFRDLDHLKIDQKRQQVFLAYKEMKISLGGIGKGYCVDKVFNFLKSKGLINFLVNGSGDLRSHSHPNAPRAWRVGITNPFNIKNSIGHLEVRNSAMATSGQYKKKNHIKSNQENLPIAVTIIGETTLDCDVWGTYLSSLSVNEGITALNKSQRLGIIIDQTGKCHQSLRSVYSSNQYLKRGIHA